ncbi:Crp/Fnr family transcriptional regulator [Brevibacillus centrosporus]|uniref:Crp/Fnr family transcriptional regulator n=1 Tax=Brevibacillus centrosporus TaxID=54910 RepID=UPI002E1C177C|nr:Crp/Fnr family transcriptional regulator [Brevibacillus centrosporus]
MISFFDDKTSPWMEDLPYDWHEVYPLGQTIPYQKHEAIFHQDQAAKHVYIVLQGRIRLFLTTPSGEEKAIAIIGKSGLLGECGLFDHPTYNNGAITASKATLLKIPVERFKEAFSTNLTLAHQVLRFLDGKNRILASHTMQLSFYSAAQRICFTLLQLGSTYGKGIEGKRIITVRFTHQELANVVGTSRVTVAGTMKELERRHILSKNGGLYVIEDEEMLYRSVLDGLSM